MTPGSCCFVGWEGLGVWKKSHQCTPWGQRPSVFSSYISIPPNSVTLCECPRTSGVLVGVSWYWCVQASSSYVTSLPTLHSVNTHQSININSMRTLVLRLVHGKETGDLITHTVLTWLCLQYRHTRFRRKVEKSSPMSSLIVPPPPLRFCPKWSVLTQKHTCFWEKF